MSTVRFVVTKADDNTEEEIDCSGNHDEPDQTSVETYVSQNSFLSLSSVGSGVDDNHRNHVMVNQICHGAKTSKYYVFLKMICICQVLTTSLCRYFLQSRYMCLGFNHSANRCLAVVLA